MFNVITNLKLEEKKIKEIKDPLDRKKKISENNKKQSEITLYGSQFALNILEATNQIQFHLTSVHLKAKEEFATERELSIAELLKYLNGVYVEKPEVKYFFILGDFNADPNECGIYLAKGDFKTRNCAIKESVAMADFPNMKFSRVPTVNINNFKHTTYKYRTSLEARTIDHFLYLARENIHKIKEKKQLD